MQQRIICSNKPNAEPLKPAIVKSLACCLIDTFEAAEAAAQPEMRAQVRWGEVIQVTDDYRPALGSAATSSFSSSAGTQAQIKPDWRFKSLKEPETSQTAAGECSATHARAWVSSPLPEIDEHKRHKHTEATKDHF